MMQKGLKTGTGQLDERISLVTMQPAPGTAELTQVGESRAVWADVFLAGITTKYAAEAVGKQVEYNAEINANAYNHESHAIYKGVTYKIDKIAPASREDRLKLILVRE